MKRFFLVWCAALIVAAVPALAQEAEDPEVALEDFFDTYDQNDDAKVTIAEMKKAMALALQVEETDISVAVALGALMCFHAAADTDDDGSLTKAEYRALAKKRTADPKYKASLSKADVEMLKKEQHGPVYKMVMDTADANKDGKLSKEEYLAMVPGGAEDFDKTDGDKDGVVTKAEMESDWKKELGSIYELPKDAAEPGKGGDKKEAGKEDAAQKSGEKPAQATKPGEPPVAEKPAPAETPDPGKVEPAKKPGPEPDKPAVQPRPASVYDKVGRKWTTRHTTKMGALENVSYRQTEVMSVADGEATIKVQILNKDKKQLADATQQKVRLPQAQPAKDSKATEETIKVQDGEFTCTVTESGVAGSKRKEWRSVKYPDLLVRVSGKDEDMELTVELVEFSE